MATKPDTATEPMPATLPRLRAEVRRLRQALRQARAEARAARVARAPLEELDNYREELRQQGEELTAAQAQAERLREWYGDLYDFAPFGYLTLTGSGLIREINLTGAAMLNLERGRVLHTPLVVHVAAGHRKALLEHLRLCRGSLSPRECDLNLAPRGGKPRPVRLVTVQAADATMADPGGVLFPTAVIDLTERHRHEAEVLAYQKRLQSLASELSLTEQRERQSIATALHDGLGQYLALAKIKLGNLRRTAGQILPEEHRQRGDAAVEEIQDLIAKTIAETRRLTVELSPPVLHTIGLEAAVEWLAEQNRRHGLTIEFRPQGSLPPLGEEVRGMLFQAARELLANVVKHAHATRVVIELRAAGPKLELAVQDDGVGIVEPGRGRSGGNGAARVDVAAGSAVPASSDGLGFGLFNILTRLEHLGGHAKITPAPGGGTRVALALPLEPAPRTADGDADADGEGDGDGRAGSLLGLLPPPRPAADSPVPSDGHASRAGRPKARERENAAPQEKAQTRPPPKPGKVTGRRARPGPKESR